MNRRISHEKNLVLRKHPCVPNPKPLVANHGWRNYSIHSPYSCHQEPGVTGPVCNPHHTSRVLKDSIRLMMSRVCNCGSASLLSHIRFVGLFSFRSRPQGLFQIPASLSKYSLSFSLHFISYHFISHLPLLQLSFLFTRSVSASMYV